MRKKIKKKKIYGGGGAAFKVNPIYDKGKSIVSCSFCCDNERSKEQ